MTLLTILSLSACRNVSDTAGSAGRAGETPVALRARLQRQAALASKPDQRALAYLGLGKACLAQGDTGEALRYLYEARKASREGEIGRQTDATIGIVYFETGDFALASRYLEKGLPGSSGEERELTLARLVIASRALGNKQDAILFRSRIRQPASPEVERLLDMNPLERNPGGSIVAAAGPDDLSPQGVPPVSVGPTDRLAPPRGTQGSAFSVLPRELWGARPIGSNVVRMGPIDKVTVHHTAGPSFWGVTGSAGAEEIRKIQRFHQQQRGWADIGYHYLVDRAGNVWQGRRLLYQGAHARGDLNRGNVGIAVLGNFCNQRPSTAQYRSLTILIEKLCGHFRLGPDRIFTHGELADGKTSCPGPALQRCVSTIRHEMLQRLVAYRASATTTR